MATASRLCIAGAFLFLLGSAGSAQTPVAPPPHPPLDELVKEYVRLKLPLPPPDAPLVRIWRKKVNDDKDPEAPRVYFEAMMGFRLPPSKPGKDPRYLVGYGRLWNDWWFDPAFVEVVEPIPESLGSVFLDDMESIPLAIQCKLRGWDSLADAVYGMARRQMAEIAELNHGPLPNLTEDLQFYALMLIERPFDDPGSDRAAILKRIKAFVAEEPSLLSPQRKRELDRLELTVAPRKSKPGTVEALIDDLTEYWVDTYGWSDRKTLNEWQKKGQEPYWKLAELGFDAVPALIEHLNDDRLSRTSSFGFNNFWPYTLTVGHLCSRLLCDLSARELFNWELRGDRLETKDAREWFAKAQKMGEEKWLLSHAVPAGKLDVRVNERGRPEAHLIRVIGAKYPKHLPELYRAVLKKPWSGYGDYIDEILASKLTREEKVALFGEGAKHEDINHRFAAIEGLAAMDKPLFRKHLLATMNEMVDRLKMGKEWEPNSGRLESLVKASNDPRCWEALTAVTKAADYFSRTGTIFELGIGLAPDEPDPIRRNRIRFFRSFLDDRTAEAEKDDDRPPVQVRDLAATQLAALYRFPVERDSVGSDHMVRANRDLGPISRLLMREAVRELAKRELSRPMK